MEDESQTVLSCSRAWKNKHNRYNWADCRFSQILLLSAYLAGRWQAFVCLTCLMFPVWDSEEGKRVNNSVNEQLNTLKGSYTLHALWGCLSTFPITVETDFHFGLLSSFFFFALFFCAARAATLHTKQGPIRPNLHRPIYWCRFRFVGGKAESFCLIPLL